VNIQSFCWGPGEPLGYVHADTGRGEVLLLFLQSAFLEGKIRPLLGFLFGLGLALQLRAHGGAAARGAPSWAWRRMAFLLLLGLAHSALLYYGDALVTYAACGTLLLALALPARGHARALVALAWLVAGLSVAGAALLATTDAEPGAMFDALPVHAVYAFDGFFAQLRQRTMDAAWQQLGSIFFGWPQQFAWIASGWLAARWGWARFPDLRPAAARAWAWAQRAGWLVGLPCALLAAAMHARRLDSALDPGAVELVLGEAGSLLAFAYLDIAGRILGRGNFSGRFPVRWLAAVGRLPLTNYIGQSLAMALLLTGMGLRLEAGASRAQLAGIALAIAALQVAASVLWLRRHANGPLEWAWRTWAYR
jgi:uncharacterized protein